MTSLSENRNILRSESMSANKREEYKVRTLGIHAESMNAPRVYITVKKAEYIREVLRIISTTEKRFFNTASPI